MPTERLARTARAPRRRQGSRRDHRRRQLRQLAGAGRRVLQGRRRRPVRPRPDARRISAATTSATSSSSPRSTSSRARSARTSSEAMWAHPNNTIKFADVPKTGVTVSRGMTHDGLGKYLSRDRREGARPDRRRRRDPQGDEDRRRRQLPAGRLRDGDEVVRRADPRGRLRDGELHAGVHRPRGLLEEALRGRRRADHRRRHQVAGRRDDHAPRADERSSASAACSSTRRCS